MGITGTDEAEGRIERALFRKLDHTVTGKSKCRGGGIGGSNAVRGNLAPATWSLVGTPATDHAAWVV